MKCDDCTHALVWARRAVIAISLWLILALGVTSVNALEGPETAPSESLQSTQEKEPIHGPKVFEALSAYLDGLHGKGAPPAKKRQLAPHDQRRVSQPEEPDHEATLRDVQSELRAAKNLTVKRIQEGEWGLASFSLGRAKKNASRLSSARESENLGRLEKFMDSAAKRSGGSSEGQTGVVVNSIGMKMLVLPGGTFTMGSSDAEFRRVRIDWNVEEDMVRPETPSHSVAISKPFLMGKYLVTVGDFKKFVDETGYKTVAEKQGWAWSYDDEKKHWEKRPGASWRDPGWKTGDDYPVTMVCHADAEAFCNWLSKREGRKYELPTEAQWEFAARGGQDQKRYPWGDEYPDGRKLNMADRRSPVPWADRTVDDGSAGPSPVGSYAPNAFGLYDIVGNVWHLCSDYYDPRFYRNTETKTLTDPQGPRNGKKKAVRGGNWAFGAGTARNAFRFGIDPHLCVDLCGFRVVAQARSDDVPLTSPVTPLTIQQVLDVGSFPALLGEIKKLVSQGRRLEARRVVERVRDSEQIATMGNYPDFGADVLDALIDLTEDDSQASFTNSLGMKMKRIPPGAFVMGSSEADIAWAMTTLAQNLPLSLENEYPFHKVRISRPFFISETEVTVEQFRKFVQATGYITDAEEAGGGQVFDTRANRFEQKEGSSWKNPGWTPSENEPVTMVSWFDAQAFVEWLSAKDKMPYKLPTEAQWEYAARGNLPMRQFPWGDEVPDGLRANYADKNTDFEWRDRDADDGHKYVAPVGSYEANKFGLYDMAGNVTEWVRDYYSEDYYRYTPEVDPEGPGHGENRVTKGGDWTTGAASLRCAFRGWSRPDLAFNNTGFRVIVELASPQSSFHLSENFLTRTWTPGADQRAVAEAVAKEKDRKALAVQKEHASSSLSPQKKEAPVRGLVVVDVAPRSEAAKTGLAKGDVIVEYHGVRELTTDVLRELAAVTKREKVRPVMVFIREGEEYTVRVGPGLGGLTVSETVIQGPFKKHEPEREKGSSPDRNKKAKPEQWT